MINFDIHIYTPWKQQMRKSNSNIISEEFFHEYKFAYYLNHNVLLRGNNNLVKWRNLYVNDFR